MGRIMLNIKTGKIKESTNRWRPEWDENPDDWIDVDHIDHRYSPHGWYYASAWCRRCGTWHARGYTRYGDPEPYQLWAEVLQDNGDCRIADYVLAAWFSFRMLEIPYSLLKEWLVPELKKAKTPEEAKALYEQYREKVLQERKRRAVERRKRYYERVVKKRRQFKKLLAEKAKAVAKALGAEAKGNIVMLPNGREIEITSLKTQEVRIL